MKWLVFKEKEKVERESCRSQVPKLQLIQNVENRISSEPAPAVHLTAAINPPKLVPDPRPGQPPPPRPDAAPQHRGSEALLHPPQLDAGPHPHHPLLRPRLLDLRLRPRRSPRGRVRGQQPRPGGRQQPRPRRHPRGG